MSVYLLRALAGHDMVLRVTAETPEQAAEIAYNTAESEWHNTGTYAFEIESEVEMLGCQWFALCENKATLTRAHPVLGAVPICKRCDDKIARIDGDKIS